MKILILFCLLLSLSQTAISNEFGCADGASGSLAMVTMECDSHHKTAGIQCDACITFPAVNKISYQTSYTAKSYVLSYPQLSQFVPDASIAIPYKPPKLV